MNYQFIRLISLARGIEPSINRVRKLIRKSCRSYTDAVAKQVRDPASAAAADDSAAAVAPLMDSFGRRHDYLRISLTERCNLRCQYCMPAEGVPLTARDALLARDELVRLVRVFAAAGVRKLRLTGGEPTLRADLADLIGELRGVAGVELVALTTNGLTLTRRLAALRRAGLGALNVSLDSLRAERYERMARRPGQGLARVLAGVDLALQLGYRPVKINTVLIKGFNDDEIGDFVEYTRDREVEVRFIEFMPFSGNRWQAGRMVPHAEALGALRAAHPGARPEGGAEGAQRGLTARVWRVPGHRGAVGFISSMTRPFCADCNRLRLTADGNLKVCLFGAAEVSLRAAARAGASDARLDALIRAALRNKKPKHAAPPVGRGAPRPSALRLGARGYCTHAFSHLDAEGRVRMVDVGAKAVSARAATAECALHVSARVLRRLRGARLAKGDALTVAQLAGVLAAKRAADLIPLCHPLPLDCVRVSLRLPAGPRGAVRVRCTARATGRTGAEMEALLGAAVAALALYDMCKSADRAMRLTDLRVVHKAGGASGEYTEPAAGNTSGECTEPTTSL